MSNKLLENGVPPSCIENTDLEALTYFYASAGATILSEICETDPRAPSDLVIIGDNWFELIMTFNEPRNASERDEQTNTDRNRFIDIFYIEERNSQESLRNILQKIGFGIIADQRDPRILREIAVLDVTSKTPPLLSEDDLTDWFDTPWGVTGKLDDTTVWYVKSGYSRLVADQDLTSNKLSSYGSYYAFKRSERKDL